MAGHLQLFSYFPRDRSDHLLCCSCKEKYCRTNGWLGVFLPVQNHTFGSLELPLACTSTTKNLASQIPETSFNKPERFAPIDKVWDQQLFAKFFCSRKTNQKQTKTTKHKKNSAICKIKLDLLKFHATGYMYSGFQLSIIKSKPTTFFLTITAIST